MHDGDGRANYACVKRMCTSKNLCQDFRIQKFSSLNVVESWICILLYYCDLLVNNSIWRFGLLSPVLNS